MPATPVLQRYAAVLDRARAKTAGGALLIHGEAGSGRTTCATHLLDELGDGASTLLSARRGQPATGLLADLDPSHPVIAIDDADLLDDPDGALPVVVRSLTAMGKLVVLTATDPARLGLSPPSIEWIDLRPLDRHDVEALVTAHGAGPVGESTLRRLGALAQGNLRTVVELLERLTPAQLRTGEGIHDDLLAQLPSARIAAAQMRNLPDATLVALQVIATGWREPTSVLLDTLDDLGLAADVLDPAEEQGWLRVSGSRIEFAHRLHRVAAGSLVPYSRRRRAISALAAVVAQRDERRSAWYEAQDASAPAPELARRLDTLAEHVAQAGEPGFAADVWREAARLDEAELEARILRASGAALTAGHLDAAAELAHRVLLAAPTDEQQVEARRIQGLVMIWQGQPDRAQLLLTDEAERIGSSRPVQASALLLQGALGAMHAGNLQTAADLAERSAVAARGLGPLETATAAIAGSATMLLGDPTGIDAVLTAAHLHDEVAPFLPGTPTLLHLTSWVGRMLLEAGEPDAAHAMLTWTADTAERHGLTGYRLLPLAHRAHLWIRRGRLDLADADTSSLEALVEQHGTAEHRLLASSLRGQLDVLAGRAVGWHALEVVVRRSSTPARIEALVALGVAHLSVGDLDEALHALDRARSVRARSGLSHPGYAPHDADLVEVLVRRGDLELATTIAKEQADVAHGWDLPLVKGLAERSLALVSDDAETSAEHVRRSIDLLTAAGAPLEAARTSFLHGERRRRARARTEARSFLRDAMELFGQVGATIWAERAANELRVAGARPPRERVDLSALTSREATVAREVASGRTNREVAAALHVSPKTVENLLSKIYAKLGVRSRTELANLLRDPDSAH